MSCLCHCLNHTCTCPLSRSNMNENTGSLNNMSTTMRSNRFSPEKSGMQNTVEMRSMSPEVRRISPNLVLRLSPERRFSPCRSPARESVNRESQINNNVTRTNIQRYQSPVRNTTSVKPVSPHSPLCPHRYCSPVRCYSPVHCCNVCCHTPCVCHVHVCCPTLCSTCCAVHCRCAPHVW